MTGRPVFFLGTLNHSNMAYSADLRSSYCQIRLNISWFYQEMCDFNMDFTFKHDDDDSIEIFEDHINEAFNDWTIYKVFGHQTGTHKYDRYENVWEFLREVADKYSLTHPEVEITYAFDDE